jgi:hypothetical protein
MSVLSRLQGANPVADESQLLADPNAMEHFVQRVQETSGLINPDVEIHTEDRTHSRKIRPSGLRLDRPVRGLHGIRVAVGTAALTLLLFSATMVFLQQGPEESAPAVREPDPMGRVESAYAALNSGDIDQWLTHFADDALIFGQTKSLMGDLYTVLSAANYTATPTDPCQQLEGEIPGESVVTCTITETNDFHGGAGISLVREETFVVTEPGLISKANARVVNFTQPGYYVFNQAFFDWLRNAHPEVHSEIRPAITTHLPSDPDHMRVALEFLDEFLEQSELYPVTPDE